MRARKCNNVCSCSPYLIWKNYAIGMGAIVAVPVASHLVSVHVLPFITLMLSLTLFYFIRLNRRSEAESCAIVPYVSARVLFIFTLLAASSNIVYWVFDEPFTKVLHIGIHEGAMNLISILFLLMVIVLSKRKWKNTFCTDCMLRNGLPSEREVLGHMYMSENRFLLSHLMKLWCFIVIVTSIPWFYDSNVHRDDSFESQLIYIYLPLAVMIVDVLCLRYYYSFVDSPVAGKALPQLPYGKGSFKMVRILLVAGNELYTNKLNGFNDTPFSFRADFSDVISYEQALEFIRKELGCFVDPADFQFCYGTIDRHNGRALEHYLCFVDDSRVVAEFEERQNRVGDWWTKQELEKEFSHGFARLLCAELHRIYTVMHTSKMYYINGRKKIRIKGYSPSFSIAELRHADVDFSDNRWMILSKFNDDMPFFHIKKAWHQYIEGLYWYDGQQ